MEAVGKQRSNTSGCVSCHLHSKLNNVKNMVSDCYLTAGTQFGDDCAFYCDSGVMIDDLAYEVQCLAHAMLDGSSGQAMHKDLHRITLCSTGSFFRIQTSSMRLDQNLEEYYVECTIGMARRLNICRSCIAWS